MGRLALAPSASAFCARSSTDAAGTTKLRGHPRRADHPKRRAGSDREAPWTPPVGDATSTEGFLLGAGTGAHYDIALHATSSATQTRTVIGQNMYAQVTTRATAGADDQLQIAPAAGHVGVTAGAPSPLDLQIMLRANDGSTRTVDATTTTAAHGSNAITFDRSTGAVRLAHRGPAATVQLVLSSTATKSLPDAVTTSVKVPRNTTAVFQLDLPGFDGESLVVE